MAKAVRLCPELLVVSPNFSAYRAASQQVMAHLHALTPLVEQISIDEAFLDVTALGEPGAEMAARLQATIRDELALSCSLGVAANKLVAKVATDVGKSLVRSGAMPQAICVVPPGDEAAFLAPLPTTALWGVGPKTAEKLAELGIHMIGDIAAWPAADLARRFGQHGEDLARRARGIDDRPIVTERAAKSITSRKVDIAGDHLCARRDRAGHAGADAARAGGRGGRKPAPQGSDGHDREAQDPLAGFHHADATIDLAAADRRPGGDRRGCTAAISPDLATRPGGAADRRRCERSGHTTAPAQPVGRAERPIARGNRAPAALGGGAGGDPGALWGRRAAARK